MTISTGAARTPVALGGLDVTYIGFLLGHGGDALQMLSLAASVQSSSSRPGSVPRVLRAQIESSYRLLAFALAASRDRCSISAARPGTVI